MWCKWNMLRLIVDRDMLYSTNVEMQTRFWRARQKEQGICTHQVQRPEILFLRCKVNPVLCKYWVHC